MKHDACIVVWMRRVGLGSVELGLCHLWLLCGPAGFLLSIWAKQFSS